MMLPVIILQLIILVTSSPQSQNTETISDQDNVEVGLPMAQALVDGENSDLGKYYNRRLHGIMPIWMINDRPTI